MEVWEDYDKVYHYTTQTGLKGVLQTQALHATHYKYLNDSTEMVHLLPKLVGLLCHAARDVLATLAKQHKQVAERVEHLGGIDVVAKSEAEKFVAVIHKITFGTTTQDRSYYQPYVVSFCGHKAPYERDNGLLSQWRAYGKDAGYAIVFNTRKLTELLKAECSQHIYSPGHMSNVVYEGDEEGFKREFQALIDGSRELMRDVFLRQMPKFDPLYLPFITGVSRYKHQGFFEEQEVRVLMSPLSELDLDEVKKKDPKSWQSHKDKTIKKVQFRDNLSPYISLFDDVEEALPIERIIVGPHPSKELRKERLTRYLSMNNLKIDVSCSKTPLI